MTKSAAIEGTILVIIVGGAIGGLIYSVFTKNDNPDAQAVAQQIQAPIQPETILDADAEPNVDADADATGGSRKRKRKGKGKRVKKSKRKGKKY